MSDVVVRPYRVKEVFFLSGPPLPSGIVCDTLYQSRATHPLGAMVLHLRIWNVVTALKKRATKRVENIAASPTLVSRKNS